MRLREWLRRWLDQSPRHAGRVGLPPDPDAAAEEDESAIDPFNPFPEPVRLEIRDVFDLHTIAPRDVRPVVEEYLREAHRAGFRTVRIIHGKGVGVQREIVRSILARTPFVEDWADAPAEAGGWGATIARLSARDERARS